LRRCENDDVPADLAAGRHIRKVASANAPAHGARMNPATNRPVILCVEDEAELRRDLADELRESGYAVIEARNGKEALERLDTIRPDLILCDISMPGLNGFEVLKATQAKASDHADIPFVFLSALADPREVVEGKRLGADDYLVKP